MPEQRSSKPEAGNLVSEVAESIDLHAYWRTIVRRRWLVIPFFLAVVLVTGIVTLRQTKIYDATCTIIIDLAAPKVLEKEIGAGGGGVGVRQLLVLEGVLRDAVQGAHQPDRGAAGGGQAAARRRTSGSSGSTRCRTRPSWRGGGRRPTRPPVFLGNLKVQPVKDSRIVRITYEDRDPQLAAQIANTLAESYIAENLSVKTVTTQNASEWLEGQLVDLEKKLDAERQGALRLQEGARHRGHQLGRPAVDGHPAAQPDQRRAHPGAGAAGRAAGAQRRHPGGGQVLRQGRRRRRGAAAGGQLDGHPADQAALRGDAGRVRRPAQQVRRQPPAAGGLREEAGGDAAGAARRDQDGAQGRPAGVPGGGEDRAATSRSC